MKIVKHAIPDSSVQIDCRATIREVDDAFDAAQIAFVTRMGLQPKAGVTPAQAAQVELGIQDLDSIVASEVVEHLWPLAIDKAKIVPAYTPQVSAQGIPQRGRECAFSLVVKLKPRMTLTSYDPITIEAPEKGGIDEAVNETLANMAMEYAGYETDPDATGPVEDGDTVLLTMEGKCDGKVAPGFTFERRPFTTGEGLMPQSFERNIVGMELGETKSFTFTLDGEDNPDAQIVDATVTVLEKQRRETPVMDDEWVRRYMPMHRTLDNLVADIREQMQQRLDAEYSDLLSGLAATEISKRLEGTFSDEAYRATAKSLQDNLKARLRSQGMDFQKYVEEAGGEQQMAMFFLMQARDSLAQGAALDEIYRHFKLSITEDDINAVCATVGPGNPMALRKQMERSGRMYTLVESAERYCASKYLVEHANIKIVKDEEQQDA